ncbi:MAG: hypothetical protein AB7S38_08940 [Vulcanimicrobiota bacterium]
MKHYLSILLLVLGLTACGGGGATPGGRASQGPGPASAVLNLRLRTASPRGVLAQGLASLVRVSLYAEDSEAAVAGSGQTPLDPSGVTVVTLHDLTPGRFKLVVELLDQDGNGLESQERGVDLVVGQVVTVEFNLGSPSPPVPGIADPFLLGTSLQRPAVTLVGNQAVVVAIDTTTQVVMASLLTIDSFGSAPSSQLSYQLSSLGPADRPDVCMTGPTQVTATWEVGSTTAVRSFDANDNSGLELIVAGGAALTPSLATPGPAGIPVINFDLGQEAVLRFLGPSLATGLTTTASETGPFMAALDYSPYPVIASNPTHLVATVLTHRQTPKLAFALYDLGAPATPIDRLALTLPGTGATAGGSAQVAGPKMAMDTAGNIVVVFEFDARILATALHVGSGTLVLDAVRVLIDQHDSDLEPEVAFGPDGTFWVAWTGYTGPDGEVYLQQFSYPTLTAPTSAFNASVSGSPDSWPSLGVNGNGDVLVVWQQMGPSGPQLMGRCLPGGFDPGNPFTPPLQEPANLLVNGDFSNGLSGWTQVVVHAIPGYPQFTLDDEALCIGQFDNERFALDVPNTSDGYIFQQVTLPSLAAGQTLRLEYRTWNNLDPVNARVEIFDVGTNTVVASDHYIPNTIEGMGVDCSGNNDALRTLDLTASAGRTVQVRLGGSSTLGIGTLVNWDDLRLSVIP